MSLSWLDMFDSPLPLPVSVGAAVFRSPPDTRAYTTPRLFALAPPRPAARRLLLPLPTATWTATPESDDDGRRDGEAAHPRGGAATRAAHAETDAMIYVVL
jgi:hypothetical protein